MIITFYSYQGGLGKTSLLIQTAVNLSNEDKDVIIIDGCLSNPSIEYCLKNTHDLSSNRGLLDYLLDIPNPRPVNKYINSSIINSSSDSSSDSFSVIDIIHAGRRERNNKVIYGSRMRELNLNEVYQNKNGGFYIEELRDYLESHYDFILIDTPTGYSSIGGICIIQMSDIIVPLFKNEELHSLQLVPSIKEKRYKIPYDRSSLVCIPVPVENPSDKVHSLCEDIGVYSNWVPVNINTRDLLNRFSIKNAGFDNVAKNLSDSVRTYT